MKTQLQTTSFNDMPKRLDFIVERLIVIEELLSKKESPITETEFVDRKTLIKRLGISVPTCIKLERAGIIINSRTGARARYDFHKVREALAKQQLRPLKKRK